MYSQKGTEGKSSRDALQAQLSTFLLRGAGFYSELVTQLLHAHGIPDVAVLGTPARTSPAQPTPERAHLMRILFGLYIAMGDLARYREELRVKSAHSFDAAMECYARAVVLYPEDGVPYNRLVVIASNEKNDLLAFYYNLMALSVPVPFLTGRANLKLALGKDRTAASSGDVALRSFSNAFQAVLSALLLDVNSSAMSSEGAAAALANLIESRNTKQLSSVFVQIMVSTMAAVYALENPSSGTHISVLFEPADAWIRCVSCAQGRVKSLASGSQCVCKPL